MSAQARGTDTESGSGRGAAWTYWRRVGWRLRRDRVSVFALCGLAAIVLLSLLAPMLAPHHPYEVSVLARLKPIGTPGHWLGTDEVGRDMLTRLLFGGRLTLIGGVLPVFVALLIGGTLGIAAGFFGGRVNAAIMRFMDVFYAFPAVLLAIAISGVLGGSLRNTVLSLVVVFIPPITRIAESVTAQVRSLDFVDAARASGAGPFAILRYHVLSNVLGPILVYATSLVSIGIILASGLSFLGLGVAPPEAEWGLMLNALRQSIYVNPGVAVLPGAMIFITSMCFNLASDGLRSAMDVRL